MNHPLFAYNPLVAKYKTMYSNDMRWRIVLLMQVYDLDASFLSDIFGPTTRSINRWYDRFERTGTVEDTP